MEPAPGPVAPGEELEEQPLSRQVFIVQELEIRDRLASSRINKFLYLHTSERMPRRAHSNMVLGRCRRPPGQGAGSHPTHALTHTRTHPWVVGEPGAWRRGAGKKGGTWQGVGSGRWGQGPRAQSPAAPRACPLPLAYHQSSARGPHDQPEWARVLSPGLADAPEAQCGPGEWAGPGQA